MKRTLAATASAIAMAGSAAFMATPAQAQPVVTGGLVNVTVTNVANDLIDIEENNVGIGVAAGIAANVCDVNVNVLVADFLDDGTAECTSEAGDQVVNITQA